MPSERGKYAPAEPEGRDMSEAFDDGAGPPDDQATPSEPHGRAALLLVESLIHGLIGRSALSVGEAIEIIEIAADIEREISLDPTLATLPALPHAMLLPPLAHSLRFDLKN